MSRTRRGCPLRVRVTTVASATPGEGDELVSLGSGFIRRRDPEKEREEWKGLERLFTGLQVTAGAQLGPRWEAARG